jgi:benzoyl-CoA reductase/2-hydroxyglutaryl-CoA dehydratase subunit BcrC/BadD/HgdB
MYVLELPQKSDDPDAMSHWVRELEKFRDFLSQRFGASITDCRLRAAIGTMNRERSLRRDLAGVMQADNPPLSGRQLLDLKSSISGIPEDFRQYERALELYRSSGTRCDQRPAGGACQEPDSKARPKVRVLMTGVPMAHGAERVLEIIENNGGLVVCMENCTGLKPLIEDVDETAADPLRALAEHYFHLPCSVMTHNHRRLDSLRDMVKTYRPQCIIELVWQACLTYDVESYRIRRLAEEELGLPYLRIETDYSPSDSARIALRVEALFETIPHGRSCGACGCS